MIAVDHLQSSQVLASLRGGSLMATLEPGMRRPVARDRATISSDWSRQIAIWVEDWHEDVVRFLARRTSLADAQDLAQEVYLRLMRVDRLDLVRQPRSYLLRIAANLLCEWRLRAHQSMPHHAAALDDLRSHDDPEREAVEAMRGRRLAEELNRLPRAVRIALILQARDELSYEEIAAKMNVTPRMIKRFLLTGFSRLRARVPPDL